MHTCKKLFLLQNISIAQAYLLTAEEWEDKACNLTGYTGPTPMPTSAKQPKTDWSHCFSAILAAADLALSLSQHASQHFMETTTLISKSSLKAKSNEKKLTVSGDKNIFILDSNSFSQYQRTKMLHPLDIHGCRECRGGLIGGVDPALCSHLGRKHTGLLNW